MFRARADRIRGAQSCRHSRSSTEPVASTGRRPPPCLRVRRCCFPLLLLGSHLRVARLQDRTQINTLNELIWSVTARGSWVPGSITSEGLLHRRKICSDGCALKFRFGTRTERGRLLTARYATTTRTKKSSGCRGRAALGWTVQHLCAWILHLSCVCSDNTRPENRTVEGVAFMPLHLGDNRAARPDLDCL